jgi:hypothetical protein
MDTFHVLIDDEMVEIPSKLFHKFFKEVDENTDPFEKMQVLDGRMISYFIEAIKDQRGEMGEETYKQCKQACKTAKRQGIDSFMFKMATESILKLYNMSESIPPFNDLIDKIYKEIENED